MHARLRQSPAGIVEASRELGWPPPADEDAKRENLLLLIDQFEEIFRYRDEGGRDEVQAFIERLLYAASQEEVPIYVIVTMRSDFLGHCATLKGLTEAINRSQYLTPTLTRDQCRKAIERPVRLFGGEIEPILVNRLLNDLGNDVDQMPILQHALMRLWTVACIDAGCQPPVRIGVSHYQRIGKLKEALSVHAEEIYHSLDDRQKQIAEVLFRNLVTMVDDHHVRRPARLGRVAEVAEASVDEVKAVIDVFRAEGRSFLMPEREVALSADSMIDISHESLVRQWSRLRAWAEAKANSEKVARYFAQMPTSGTARGGIPASCCPTTYGSSRSRNGGSSPPTS